MSLLWDLWYCGIFKINLCSTWSWSLESRHVVWVLYVHPGQVATRQYDHLTLFYRWRMRSPCYMLASITIALIVLTSTQRMAAASQNAEGSVCTNITDLCICGSIYQTGLFPNSTERLIEIGGVLEFPKFAGDNMFKCDCTLYVFILLSILYNWPWRFPCSALSWAVCVCSINMWRGLKPLLHELATSVGMW